MIHYQLFGGINDGLELSSPVVFSTLAFPSTIVLRGNSDYRDWSPSPGDSADVYLWDRMERETESGEPLMFMHLYQTVTLTPDHITDKDDR
ncbi:hypothetical protein HOT45_gp43 [Gordonia phage Trine]|uniref:Uncharacterized protein n=1 Tax=Gordonia phage Trine TaxID=2201431 RepID=A0A2Z4Q959_9CAUD|nr:hypothetical protein HOT45_gp43 [Gordonia phage Trine]AWY06544.1 hypothetical protein PBI_TRINE_43 [Gordonia phage Trine]